MARKGYVSFFESKKETKKPPFFTVKAAFAASGRSGSTASGQRGKAAHAVRTRTAKSRRTSRKISSLIFRLAFGFSSARKLSWRHTSYKRKLFVIAFKPNRPVKSRGRRPLAQSSRARSARKTCPWAGFQRRAGRKAPGAEASNGTLCHLIYLVIMSTGTLKILATFKMVSMWRPTAAAM